MIGKFGELSYHINKNPAKQDSPPAAGRFSDMLPLRRSAFLPGGLFVPKTQKLIIQPEQAEAPSVVSPKKRIAFSRG